MEINGIIVSKDISWFKHFSILGMELKFPYNERINDIYFVPITILKQVNNYDYTPLFKKPIEEKINGKIFRIIPRYPDHMVSSDGEVIYTTTHNPVKIWFSDQYSYNYCTIKDNYLLRHYSSVPVHRLVAMAWIENSDYVSKYLVDHIDNNPNNNTVENLRWVTHSENTRKALSDQRIPIDVREITTHKTYSFNSIKEASRFLGVNIGNISNPLVSRPGRIWETKYGNYEIRVKDSKPWYYTSKTKFEKKNILLILNGEFTYYKTWKEIPLYFGLNPNDFITPIDLINLLKKRYGIVEIKDIRGGNRLFINESLYEIKNIQTKKIITCNTVNDIAKYIGAHSVQSVIYRRISSGNERLPYRGWLIRIKSDTKWADDLGTMEDITNRSKPVIAIDQYGQKQIFVSRKELGRKFNLTNHQINHYLESKKPIIFRTKIYTLEVGPA